jgi:uncharacterized protein
VGVEVRAPGASAVVVQRVPPARADWFMEWQRGVTAAAEGFAGYRATEVYPPAGDGRDEWVVLVHFADEKSLRQWLDSPVRAQWVERLRARAGDFELKALPGGFGPWFAGVARRGDAAPLPSWKMALAVLFGLYPTAMLLAIFVGPYIERLGPAVAMLISNALSISILQWVVTPLLTVVLARWLTANARQDRALSVGGLWVLLVLLAALTLVFRQVTG